MGFSFIVEAEESGSRLEAVLRKRFPDAARKPLRALLGTGVVRVTGTPAAKGTRLEGGQEVTCEVDLARRDFEPLPDPDLPVRIVHEDEHLLVVDKPAGMPSHPLSDDQKGALANWLVAHYPETVKAGLAPREAGLVQRLDVGTSGLLLVARSKKVHTLLWDLGKAGGIRKTYFVLGIGRWHGPDRMTWPIAAHPSDRARVVAVKSPRERYRGRLLPAETELSLLRQLGRFFLARVSLVIGRRHQVRVHLSAAGNPLAGDTLYRGVDAFGLGRPFLHAGVIELIHPVTKKPMTFESPLPEDLGKALETAIAIRDQFEDRVPGRGPGGRSHQRGAGPRRGGPPRGGQRGSGGGRPGGGGRDGGPRREGGPGRDGRPGSSRPSYGGGGGGGNRQDRPGPGRPAGRPGEGRPGGGPRGPRPGGSSVRRPPEGGPRS